MKKIKIEEITEYRVLCPKEPTYACPNDDCGECKYMDHDSYDGKTWFIHCKYQSPNQTAEGS